MSTDVRFSGLILALWVCDTCGAVISCRSDRCEACKNDRHQQEQIIHIALSEDDQ